jgi:hypothetical protein
MLFLFQFIRPFKHIFHASLRYHAAVQRSGQKEAVGDRIGKIFYANGKDPKQKTSPARTEEAG